MKRVLLAFLVALSTTAAFGDTGDTGISTYSGNGSQPTFGDNMALPYSTTSDLMFRPLGVQNQNSVPDTSPVIEFIGISEDDIRSAALDEYRFRVATVARLIELEKKVVALKKKITILVNMKRLQHKKVSK